MLPWGIWLDTFDDFLVVDKAFEEFLPLFGKLTCAGQHVSEFFDTVVRQSGSGLIVSGHEADDITVGEVDVIVDDRLKKIDVLFGHFGDIICDVAPKFYPVLSSLQRFF